MFSLFNHHSPLNALPNPLIIHSILAYRLSVFFRTSARTSCMYDRFLGCAFQMIEFFRIRRKLDVFLYCEVSFGANKT